MWKLLQTELGRIIGWYDSEELAEEAMSMYVMERWVDERQYRDVREISDDELLVLVRSWYVLEYMEMVDKAREQYHDAKAALYLACRDADRLSSKMIREAEALVWSAEAAMREACAAIDAADAAQKKAHYWGARVEAGKRLDYVKKEGFAPLQIKEYQREYDNACDAYDAYMNDDDY